MRRRLAFAAVAGRTKGNVRNACQDDVFGKGIGSLSCVALSDGAGSKKHSRTGARTTVRLVTKLVFQDFDAIFENVHNGNCYRSKKKIIEEICGELKKKRFAIKGNTDEYACTLLFAATNGDKLLFGHLGDGVAVAAEKENCRIYSEPDNGEFANETYFVTSRNAIDRFRLKAEVLSEPLSILLASDGAAQSLIRRTDGKIATAVSTLCKWTCSSNRKTMNRILKKNLETTIRQRTTDDCSIAINADPKILE
ncbi:MAG: PP2C family serine/threonine-protein phosphatase [Albidovulum sp.]|nr:PP2C family serine/threonine-protein phosphatase [Albidovulum sp.]